MTLTISNKQVEVKQIADFISQMDNGTNDNGKYQKLIESSVEKQSWIEANFKLTKLTPSMPATFSVNLNEAFKVIEA